MNLRRPLLIAAVLTLLYVLALVWVDSRNSVFEHLPQIAAIVPALTAFSLTSYMLRYARWRWLLRRAHRRTPALRGWLAYLAGFAFTATPGKVGELVRIRYFLPMGVPPARVLAAFVFERATDLIALVLIGALAISHPALFALVLVFVLALLAGLVVLGANPHPMGFLAARLRRRGWTMLARTVRTLQLGLTGCSAWLNPLDVLVSTAFGLAAWGLTALSFAWLLMQLDIQLPLHVAVSIYPTAMLAGAASLLPGGVGPTEVVIVTLLALHAVPVWTGAMAAVSIRIATLWFAVACGFLSIALLEHRSARQAI